MAIADTSAMKALTDEKRLPFYLSALVLAVTIGHYLIAPHYAIVHNILQRLYYVPIIWAAYKYGKKGGVLVSVISALLYVPHIFISWNLHPEYQVNQMLEVMLFVIIGYSAGILLEQKANHLRMLQSYEKMALFGHLSRTIIRSLKTPIKVIKGMLLTLEPLAQKDAALQSALTVVKDEVDVIQNVRNDLISLVERKRPRLKKQNLNEIMFGFMSEIEVSLRLRKILFSKKTGAVKLSAYIHKASILDTLHYLVSMMIDSENPPHQLKMYTGESASCVWLGATIEDHRLSSYYLSDLSCLNIDCYPDYNLINVINTMNNHFGDVRFRWDNKNLLEFILVFPKKLKLPWYLKDEPVQRSKQLSHSIS
ncbi:MAG: hypothetical protein ACE5K8_01155 [Candidatus Zixiibacteriota bacterium]